ncbi:MAG: glycosyltransferase family 4 protein [Candidatus Omnitrophica bacterium]|nr:glycosyltransferase family 4 protein [Candidatus Omnitrophota bacterium]
MKIALYNLTTTVKNGGIETFCWGLARNLSSRGIEVDLYGGNSNKIFPSIKNLRVIPLPYIPRDKFPNFGSRFRKFMERLSFCYHAFPQIRKNRYNFFCIFKPFDLPLALLIKKIKSSKIIFFSGGTEFFIGYKTMAKKIDFFFSCSKFNAKQIEDYCGIKPLILPNGIDTELFKPLQPATKLKEFLEIDEEKILITVCRLVGWKGVQYGVKALKILLEKGYKIKYLIIGEGEYRRNLEKLVKDLEIREKVLFLGNIENSQLPKYYSLAHIAIFPSIADETFGISIGEAMACGVPVISTKVGGIPEVVGDAGILVNPKDENAIAQSLEHLITNPHIRNELAMRARKRIINLFSWEIIINKFLEHISA